MINLKFEIYHKDIQDCKCTNPEMFFLELEMVSGYSKYPREALLKVSSRSNIRKLVKTTPIIKVSSWSLGGPGGS